MRLHETKKLLPNKRNGHQIDKTAQRMEENLCQLYIWQGINSQNIPGAQKTKLQRINDPRKKWANELHRTFSKEEIHMAKKHMKKCSPSLTIKKI
jgi:hypothetical protein